MMCLRKMNTDPTKTLLTIVFLLVFVSVARSTDGRSTDHADHLLTFNPTAFCKHTAPFKNLCTKVVHTAHGLSMTSPLMVVEANVNTAVEEAQHALAEISSLAIGRRKNYPGMTGSVLRSCKENYDSAVASLHNTQRILSSRTGTFVGTCTDDLETVPEMKYPIHSLHTKLEHLVRNCLDLAAVLI
ncbi:Plant invertase/pectin methylesterase inhibitor [Carex littledalei]|uniref:Plant invertase/pectin methylesterase inhibitor n=1 Tax=Carex littledalei TaxID=544730 RepID=A0A833QUL7_9POAL|nr:Plant invertase/pectin methylesterase inhibitor [Carex littledalei]